jgi:hypothetical protein
MNKESTISLTDLPALPANATFNPIKIESVCIPHPFMITHKHVAYASDHHSGMLDSHAINASGEPCGMPNCLLSIDEHETQENTVFIEVEHHELNDIEGLHGWLMSIKEDADLDVSVFAFPLKK